MLLVWISAERCLVMVSKTFSHADEPPNSFNLCSSNRSNVRILNIRRTNIRNNFQSGCLSNRNACMCFIRAPCCWRISTCAPREFIFSSHPSSPVHTEKKTSGAADNLIVQTEVTSKTKVKSIPQMWLSAFLCNSESAFQMCAGLPDQSCPSPGFQEGYLQLSWHSSSEDGVDWSPLIEDTLERCAKRVRQSWCKRDLQWLRQCWGVTLSPVRWCRRAHTDDRVEFSTRLTSTYLSGLDFYCNSVRVCQDGLSSLTVYENLTSGLWSALCVTSVRLVIDEWLKTGLLYLNLDSVSSPDPRPLFEVLNFWSLDFMNLSYWLLRTVEVLPDYRSVIASSSLKYICIY